MKKVAGYQWVSEWPKVMSPMLRMSNLDNGMGSATAVLEVLIYLDPRMMISSYNLRHFSRRSKLSSGSTTNIL